MAWCSVKSCCFGCQPLKPGLYILSILNLFLNLLLALIPRLVVSFVNQNGHLAWLSILIAADILLAVGTKAGIRLLLLPWLIVNAINIVLLIPLAIFLLVLSCVVISKSDSPMARDNSTENSSGDPTGQKIDYMLERMEDSGTVKAASCLFYLILAWYIYLWILARSLFVKLGEWEQNTTTWIRRVRRVHHIQQQEPIYTIESGGESDPTMMTKQNNHWFYGDNRNQPPLKLSKQQFQQKLDQHFAKKKEKEIDTTEGKGELENIGSENKETNTNNHKGAENFENPIGVLKRDDKIIN